MQMIQFFLYFSRIYGNYVGAEGAAAIGEGLKHNNALLLLECVR